MECPKCKQTMVAAAGGQPKCPTCTPGSVAANVGGKGSKSVPLNKEGAGDAKPKKKPKAKAKPKQK